MDWFNDLSQSLSNPAMRHAMLVHWPVVLGGIGIVLALLVAVTAAKNKTLQWLALVNFSALALIGLVAKRSGEDAEDAIAGSLPAAASRALERHEDLAEWVWIFAAGIAVAAAMTFLKPRAAKLAAAWMTALASVFMMTWIASVAHLGGMLVYEFGVGTGRSAQMPSQQQPDAVGRDDETGAADDAGDDTRSPRSHDLHERSSPSTSSRPLEGEEEFTPSEQFFVAEVRPLLEQHCWKCHNPQRLKGGLDQTTREAFLRGGTSGAVIDVGNPEDSLVMKALSWDNEDLQMPPKQRLSNDQIAVIARWIEDGAAWVDVGAEGSAATQAGD